MTKLSCTAIAVMCAASVVFAAGEAEKPPPEIADLMRMMAGTWRCEGTFRATGMAMTYTSTIKPKTELGGFWVHETIDAKPVDKKMMPRLAEAYMTYDATAKKWRRVEMMNDGQLFVGTSDGMKDMKLEMIGDTYTAHGPVARKVDLDATDLRRGLRITGQTSKDKGATWTPVFEETCKK